jgi:hypothetical protein
MSAPDKSDDRDRKGRPWSSPYGPHPHGVDEASGGADSSPYEGKSSDERAEAAEAGIPAEGIPGEN